MASHPRSGTPPHALALALLLAACTEGSAANEALKHQRYQEGVALLTAGGEANVSGAIQCFREALLLDSAFAPAWAGISRGYFNLGPRSATLPPERTLAQARDAAERAAKLAPGDPAAYVVLANVRSAYWDWAGAKAAFQRALELDPEYLGALRGQALILFVTGQHAESRALLSRAAAAQPQGGDLFLRYLIGGDADAPTRMLSERIAAAGASPDPEDLWSLARIYAAEGRHADALGVLARQIPLMHGDVADETALAGYLNARLGKKEEARQNLEELRQLALGGRYVSPVHAAWVQIGLGRDELALALLTEAVNLHAHRTGTGFRTFGFIYRPIAADPRFGELLGRMGLSG